VKSKELPRSPKSGVTSKFLQTTVLIKFHPHFFYRATKRCKNLAKGKNASAQMPHPPRSPSQSTERLEPHRSSTRNAEILDRMMPVQAPPPHGPINPSSTPARKRKTEPQTRTSEAAATNRRNGRITEGEPPRTSEGQR
jgi:hypothetical protein